MPEGVNYNGYEISPLRNSMRLIYLSLLKGILVNKVLSVKTKIRVRKVAHEISNKEAEGKARFFLLARFPPPIGNMAVVNEVLFECFKAGRKLVEKIDTSPKTLERDLILHFSRLRRILRTWVRLLQARRHQDRLYIALSGGWGQVYDIISLGIARMMKMRCIIHHHSFAYLNILVDTRGWQKCYACCVISWYGTQFTGSIWHS